MDWRTRLVQPQALARGDFKALTVPTYRASTVLFDSVTEVIDTWKQQECGYSYGLHGTPTALELALRVAQLEGAMHTFIVPGGQAAISLVYLSLCPAGSHALVPHSAYGPNKSLGGGLLRRLGIEVEGYDPMIGSGIAELIRDNTVLIWTESPGSVTMEIQDVPAICAAARARGVPVALDNTYSAGVLFDAFAHGVDVSIQALTKYVGGHSDLLLGSVSVRSAELRDRIGESCAQIGMGASPDDCSLALRGLQSLAVRLDHLESATLQVAHWLAQQPPIATVLHPALPSCPGHATWKRDFSGSSSVFSVIFQQRYTAAQVAGFVDALRLFKVGMSWGGVTSLALVYPGLQRPGRDFGGRLVRINVGLEDPADLLEDLAAALSSLQT